MSNKNNESNNSISRGNDSKMNEDRGLPPVKDHVKMPKVKPAKDKK